jgi:hypothetical protein
VCSNVVRARTFTVLTREPVGAAVKGENLDHDLDDIAQTSLRVRMWT